MLRDQQGYRAHQGASRGVGAVLGLTGSVGAQDPVLYMGHWGGCRVSWCIGGLVRSAGAQGPAGYRGSYGVSGDIGVMRGYQGSIGAWQGV